jgi:hypothetical protein
LLTSVIVLLAAPWINSPVADWLPRGVNVLYAVLVLILVGLQIAFPWQAIHDEAVTATERRLQEAMNQLKDLLNVRLNYDDPGFLGAHSVRALALGIQKRVGSPPLNDILIAETLRILAVDVEDARKEAGDRGEKLARQLKALQSLLNELEPGGGSPLLSIVEHDPLSAYRISRPLVRIGWILGGILVCPLVIAGALVWLYPWWLWALAYWLSFGLYGVFVLSGIRARNYWRNSGSERNRRRGAISSLFSPAELNPVLDCMSYVLVGYSAFSSHVWSVYWAPIWESPYFISPDLGGYTWEDVEGMHTFRFFVALPLRTRLNELHPLLLTAARDGPALSPLDLDEYAKLCRQLYVLTGAADYRLMEKEARRGGLLNVDLNLRNVDMTPRTRNAKPDPCLGALRGRFETLHRNRLLHELGKREMAPTELEEYVSLCERLAAATGSARYRGFGEKGKDLMRRQQ